MIINLILGAVVVIQSIIHFIERRDMYNRLMSKDLKDYTRNIGDSSNKHTSRIPSAHERVLKNWKKSFKVGEE